MKEKSLPLQVVEFGYLLAEKELSSSEVRAARLNFVREAKNDPSSLEKISFLLSFLCAYEASKQNRENIAEIIASLSDEERATIAKLMSGPKDLSAPESLVEKGLVNRSDGLYFLTAFGHALVSDGRLRLLGCHVE